MPLSQPRVRLPETARPGETIRIRTLIGHPMESGFRLGPDGARVPRDIIVRFECSFEGEPVVACVLEPAIAANPFFEFSVKVVRSGVFRFRWTDDVGETVTAEAGITVG